MKNIYCSIKPPRLNLYYNYIGSFDFIDKKSNCYYLNECSPKVEDLIFQTNFSSTPQNKINILIFGLTLELITNQRFLLNYSWKKSFSESNFTKVTLQKQNFFLVLDILLNSFFLNESYLHNLNKSQQLLILSSLKFSQNLQPFFNNSFNLTLFSLNLNYFISLIFSKLENADFSYYYLIPS